MSENIKKDMSIPEIIGKSLNEISKASEKKSKERRLFTPII